jgi:hypothetical protein
VICLLTEDDDYGRAMICLITGALALHLVDEFRGQYYVFVVKGGKGPQ